MLAIRAALAQAHHGSISVQVFDENRAVVTGANVVCQNLKDKRSKDCQTDSSGHCSITGLEAGSYDVTIDEPGFKIFKIIVGVTVGAETPIEAVLTPTGVTTQISIVAEPVLIDKSSTTGAVPISERVMDLPINGRNFIELGLLVPGAVLTPSTNGATPLSFGGYAVNGNRSRSNNFLVDGVDVADTYRNTIAVNEPGTQGTSTLILSKDAIQEFSVLTNYGADAGRNSGSILNIVTKSGTNKVHGSVFQYFRNNALDARDFFNSTGPENKLRYNDFGIAVGGPFREDKAFWFVSYNGRRERKEVTTLSAVPTESDFIRAITSLGGNPDIAIEKNPAVNPVIRSLFALCRSSAECPGGASLWPLPTPGREGLTLNALSAAPGSNSFDNLLVKPDFNISERHHVAGYYLYGEGEQSSLLEFAGGDDLPRTNTLTSSDSRVATISYTFTITPTMVNDLRFGWNRHERDFADEDRLGITNPATSIGLNTGVFDPRDFGLPHLVIRDFAFLGASPYSNPRGRTARGYHLAERFTLVSGIHNLSMGYEFRRASIDSLNEVNYRGRLEFASLADFLAGNIARGSISRGDSNRTTVQDIHSIYAQDNYRLSRNLNLNLGLRWDYFGVLREADGLFSRYDPSVGLVRPDSLYEPDLNNISPRIGVVWDPTGEAKTVVRASIGLYYDGFPQDYFVGQIQFNTFNPGVAYNAISERPILSSRSPVRTIRPNRPLFPQSSFFTDTRDATTVGRIRTPYTVNYALNIQKELIANGVLEVGYVGTTGRNLFRTRNTNAPIVPGGARPFDSAAGLSDIAPNRPFIVNQIETTAKSNYNSIQVRFTQRQWEGLTNYAQWTWSHAIDDASDGIDFVPNQASPDNPRFPERERANSNFDTRHRITWGLIYDLPERLVRTEGLQILSNLTLLSGQPYHINIGEEFDSQGAYDFILRPDVVADPHFGTSAPDRLLNLAAFKIPCTLNGRGTDVSNCVPGTLHFGNLPRNAFVGPNLRSFDFSISKTTKLNSDHAMLQLRADFFNVTNHPNFASPLVPRFIARASAKGIDLNGQGGARGRNCNTPMATDDCYLQTTRTQVDARSIQLSVRFYF
jgi:hypothetical protein